MLGRPSAVNGLLEKEMLPPARMEFTGTKKDGDEFSNERGSTLEAKILSCRTRVPGCKHNESGV